MPRSRLDEMSYTDLYGRISWDFIHMLDHYRWVESYGVKFEGQDFDISHFSSGSESFPGQRRHRQWIKMLALKGIIDQRDMSIGDKVRLAMAGDIQVHCTCEAFLFWGYQFILTTMNAALWPEQRPPNIRNPQRRGTVCKHLGVVIKVFPFWWSNIAGTLDREGLGGPPPSMPGPAATVGQWKQEPAVPPGTEPPEKGPGEALCISREATLTRMVEALSGC